jgi:hypothetical protein
MKKLDYRVKSELEIAESALRKALSYSENIEVYKLKNIVDALIEIDNTLFAERVIENSNPQFLKEDNIINYDYVNMNIPGSYTGSHIKGGIGDDVISF